MTLVSQGPRQKLAHTATDLIVLEILHHSDLSRIGHGMVVCGVDDAMVGHLVVGRDEPVFDVGVGPDGTANPSPLDDPCISRQQLSVRWTGELVELGRHEQGRSEVRFFDLDGQALRTSSGAVRCAPPVVVDLGGRALLLVSRRPAINLLDRDPAAPLVGQSEAMIRLRKQVEKHAEFDRDVLLVGETGIGKSLVARALHDMGRRKNAPFVTLDCAALTRSVLEAELFGHDKGAFTDAKQARRGLALEAHGGTLFLDEVGELPLDAQTRLLRLVQERRVRPVGGQRDVEVDARLIFATSRPLTDMVADGTFRKELFYRINLHPIDIPPLRARKEDIPLLFSAFARRAWERARAASAGKLPELDWLSRRPDAFDPEVPLAYILALLAYDWPGNIRELLHHAEAAVAASIDEGGSFIVPKAFAGPPSRNPGPEAHPALDLSRMTQAELLDALKRASHNQSETARSLGVSRKALRNRMDALGIRQPKDVPDAEVRGVMALATSPEEAASRLGMPLKDLRERMGKLGL